MTAGIRVHRVALEPNDMQRTALARAAGVARFAYNWALAEWQHQYHGGGRPNETALRRELNARKRHNWPWMLDSPKAAPQQAIKDLGRAWSRYFSGHARKPQFKKKGIHDSFRADNGPGTVAVSGRGVRLPRIGWLRMREHLRFSGRVKSVVVSRTADRWFAAISVEVDEHHRDAVATGCENQGPVGVDLGVTDLAVLSDGTRVGPPKALDRHLRKLRALSKAHSRKQCGSANRAKSAMQLARLHRRIRDIRHDALHQLTTYLVRHHDEIVIEDLNVAGMMKNRRLAQRIADVGFYEFRRQLLYKAERAGVRVTVADRFEPTSKRCSVCGHVYQELELGERTWTCTACDVRHDRDLNAAINLQSLAASSAVTARGESGADFGDSTEVEPASMKREPVAS